MSKIFCEYQDGARVLLSVKIITIAQMLPYSKTPCLFSTGFYGDTCYIFRTLALGLN